jgi:hypothetical protein
MNILNGLLVAALLSVSAPTLAQDKVERNAALTFGTVEAVKFKSNTSARVQELEDKYFIPAGRAAGLMDPVIVHLNTGDWDAIYFFPTKLGLSVMEYRNSPDDVAFMAALGKLAGGSDKAMAMIKEWDATIEKRVRHAGHVHPMPK